MVTRPRTLAVVVLLLGTALVLLGIATFWGIEAEGAALRDQERREVRALLGDAARLVREDVGSQMKRALVAGEDWLRDERRGPPAQPSPGAPLVVVRDGTGRQVHPWSEEPFVTFHDLDARHGEDPRWKRVREIEALAKRSAAAANQILREVAESESRDDPASIQARYQMMRAMPPAEPDARMAELRTLAAHGGRGLVSAQRFVVARERVADAADRRDAEALQEALADAIAWLIPLVAQGETPGLPWLHELATLTSPLLPDEAAALRRQGQEWHAIGRRATPAAGIRPPGPGPDPGWVRVGPINALARSVPPASPASTTTEANEGGEILVLPAEDVALDGGGVLSGLRSRGWSWRVADTEVGLRAEAEAATIGGPYPSLRLEAQRESGPPLPWRTVLGAVFLLACLTAMALGILLFLRSVRDREATLAARTEFLATVAHQLKTPVANLRLFSETLATEGIDKDDRSRMHGILESEARKLSDQIDRVLAMTRLDTTGAAIQEPIDVARLIRDTGEHWSRMAKTRGVQLALSVPDALPSVRGDPVALSDALQNVVDNAVRFTPREGEVTVAASAENGAVFIRVTDAGPGIPDDQRERVFERFFRGDASRRRAGEGTGLGLAIAREGARRAGGDIRIEASGAHGTTMTFTLPTPPKDDHP